MHFGANSLAGVVHFVASMTILHIHALKNVGNAPKRNVSNHLKL